MNYDFNEVYKTYYNYLFSIALRKGREHSECKDVVHDAFTALLCCDQSKIYDIRAFLAEIVRMRCYKLHYKDDLHKRKEEDIAYLVDTIADQMGDFEREALLLRAYEIADKKLVGKNKRDIFYLTFIKQLNTIEISQILGIGKSAVTQARQKMLEDLREEIWEKDDKRHKQIKLSDKEVVFIRQHHKEVGTKVLAERFSVSTVTINSIIRGVSYSRVA